MTCPHCGEPLMGLGTFCWACKRYTDEAPKGEAASTQPPAAPDTRSEEDIRLATRRALEAHGWFVIDLEQSRKGEVTRVVAGLPDLAIMGWGHFAWAEIKSATGRQRDSQKAFQKTCEGCGIPYHLWRHESEAIAWSTEQRKLLGAGGAK